MSLPMVSVGGNIPVFTIEQIELIRRLRNSGITKEQVIQAFDSLDRIDSELGHLYTIPQSLAPMVVKTVSPPRPLQRAPNGVPAQGVCKQIKKTLLNVCQSAKASSTTEAQGAKRRRRSSLDDDGTDETSETACGDESETHNTQNTPTHGVDEELKVRLEEFMRLPAPRRLEEILVMVSVAGVQVPDIAASTGLSNTTISRFLQGETVDISTNQKRSIYLWYLRQVQKTEGGYLPSTSPIPVVHSPTSLGTSRSKVMQVIPQTEPSKQELSTGPEKGFEYPGRRERFIFRESHLEILDEAFRSNQYPSGEEREEIAQRCNKALRAIVGKELSERQTVTCVVVSNWFNNRRKEIKRIAREEGIACSQVVLPSRQKQRLQSQTSPTDSDSNFQAVDENTSSSMGNDSESNQLDPATINKLLYEVTDNNLQVKLEPPDENNY